MQHPEVLTQVYCRGSQIYRAWGIWRHELDRKGIRCSVCEDLRDHGIDHLDALVVERHFPELTISSVFGLGGGIVMRNDVIDTIGAGRLGQICHFRPVVLFSGTTVPGVQYLVEKMPRGCFRGDRSSNICLCSECGRLMYWPMPVKQWYILRAYWDGADDVTVMDGELLCTPRYYDEVLAPRHFPRLTADTHTYADVPVDGLPIDYDELIAEVRKRGWFCK